MSTAYHPQTDGETERVNQEMEIYLRMFCSNNQEQWKDLLPMAEFAHNNRQHSARKQSPFYLMMGYNPTSIPFITEWTNVPSVDKRLAELQDARSEALAMHELARQTVLQRN